MIALAMSVPSVLQRLHHNESVVIQPQINPERVAQVDEQPVPAINQTAHEVNVRVQTAMAENQWFGLDHDVRLATQYFVDQAPIRSAIDLGSDDRRSNHD